MSAYAVKLVQIANGEFNTFHQIDESDEPLRSRINEYCSAVGIPPPDDIGDFPWSAVFISWCAKTAGATAAEFKFSDAHAVFVQAAIQNAESNVGVFRGRRVDSYKPKVGDIIQRNRSGGTITYDQARARSNYPSHSAIVVEVNQAAAITVGGNETDSVRRKQVPLTSSGLIQAAPANPYICVIENLKVDAGADAGGPAIGGTTQPAASAGARPISGAFKKHGTFIYNAVDTIGRYGSVANVVSALQRAEMQHAWVRVHGRRELDEVQHAHTKSLIDALKTAGIAVAGWGWCQGSDIQSEASLAIRKLGEFGLVDYVADIENGVGGAEWSAAEVKTFCQILRSGVSGTLAITTFPLIDWHEPDVMAPAKQFVDVFAPQVYWFNFPNSKMVRDFHREDGTNYIAGLPSEYANLCLDRWAQFLKGSPRPVVMTGQAYWGEGSFTKDEAQRKLDSFLGQWSAYDRIVGLN